MDTGMGRSLSTGYFLIADQLTREELARCAPGDRGEGARPIRACARARHRCPPGWMARRWTVVLTGAGGNFSYGLDLPAMLGSWEEVLAPGAAAEPRTRFLGIIRGLQAAVSAVADCKTPVVAAVSGWCVGGGVDLIAAADVRLAAADARFSVREVKVAIVADLSSLQRLAGILGEGHLRELALTGKDIDAARAERIGLVNDIYPTAWPRWTPPTSSPARSLTTRRWSCGA